MFMADPTFYFVFINDRLLLKLILMLLLLLVLKFKAFFTLLIPYT